MSEPVYVLAAAIPAGNRLRHFFNDSVDSPKYLLENPPSFRWAGFDCTTHDRATLRDDRSYEVRGGDRKVIRLYQDGTFLFRMAADSDFLAWGQDPDEFRKFPRLNPIAVVEAHASALLLYTKLTKLLIRPVSQVTFSLRLTHAMVADQPIGLTKYYERGIHNVYHPQLFRAQLPDNQEDVIADMAKLQKSPFAVAFDVLRAFYQFFDMDEELIPFVLNTPNGKEIDVETIKRL